MRKLVLLMTFVILVVGGVTWRTHLDTIKSIYAEQERSANVAAAVANSEIKKEELQGLLEEAKADSVFDINVTLLNLEQIAPIIGASIYTVGFDIDSNRYVFNELSIPKGIDSLADNVMSMNRCVIRVALESTDMVKTIKEVGSLGLPVIRFEAESSGNTCSVYMIWVKEDADE